MRNNLIIIYGPSGSGQDSVIEGLEKILPLDRVITTTTRPMRPAESQGKPYYFISAAEFKKLINGNLLYEYAQGHNGQYYGVTTKEINRAKQSKRFVAWKLDIKGVIAAKKLMPEVLAIRINAPIKTLRERITKRDKDRATAGYLKERMAYNKELLRHEDVYDYDIMNYQGKLDEAVERVAEIIKNETKKTAGKL